MPTSAAKPAKTAPARPTAHMRMSPEARQRLRDTDTVQYRYYNDMGKNKGHCTWGIGVLAHRGVCTEEELGKEVSVAVELNQLQFDALVSFTYNTGVGGASNTYKLLNANDFAGAAANMQQFVRVQIKTKKGTKKVVAGGLVKRRAEEWAPFLNLRK